MAESENSREFTEFIAELDSLYGQGKTAEAAALLEEKLWEAREKGDWSTELSILSEQMGLSRRCGGREDGLEAVEKGLKLIKEHGMENSISGATVTLNAATTLQCFGETERAVGLFEKVSAVYSENLRPGDYRLAGLYNNMALTYEAAGDFGRAERLLKQAFSQLERNGGRENEQAVTMCSLAELYGRLDSEDERIEKCMERAWELLNSPQLHFDGYHAFTVEKCLPVFDYFGYFIWAKALRERVKLIHERN